MYSDRSDSAGPGIELENVSKTYARSILAVRGVTLRIRGGEFMVLVGPSGCGKSTLLRLIAGLEEVSEGAIRLGGEDVTSRPPGERDVAMVFQNYALYPHMTVARNLSFALRVRRMPKDEVWRQVEAVAQLLGLEGYLERKPAALSGGQRQRVAMGRAIIRRPAAYLMDEPLSNLDAELRVAMRGELARLHARLRTTTVYVTHDQVEAMTLGHRIAVMRDGAIEQVGTPQEVYAMPANLFVASFIGSPAMNLVEAMLDEDAVEFAGIRVPLGTAARPAHAGRVILGIRPSDFHDARGMRPGLTEMEVRAEVVEDLGSETAVLFPVEAPSVDRDQLGLAQGGDEARLLARSNALFTARLSTRSGIEVGSSLRLGVDPSTLYFFDCDTGAAVPKVSGRVRV